ncbi:MAG: hypothetical protein KC505_06365 [Myxococcales bacterium]|nr:hypothetical protein [Myxococcales bacterium]USN51364.1 MAG: hypothetical protein H6731_02855 [Myxococcales bacterium]
MIRLCIGIFATVVLVSISCGITHKEEKTPSESETTMTADAKALSSEGNPKQPGVIIEDITDNEEELAVPIADDQQNSKQPTQPKEPEQPQDPAKPITHYNSEALDNAVREEAKKFGKDPSTYRKFVRTEADGTEIYRMIGMFVIVHPMNEESFLPDEI